MKNKNLEPIYEYKFIDKPVYKIMKPQFDGIKFPQELNH